MDVPDRSAAEAIDAPGTPEKTWASWRGLARLPVAEPPAGPVLVVAAHPDDEVLGFGGTMAALAALGTDVHLVSVTDGEASHPHHTHVTPERLARMRVAELGEAMKELGLPGLRQRRLRVPDTQVHRHEERVRDTIAAVAAEVGAAVCVAPWAGDLHSDHEAVGRAAAAASRTTGTPLWEYPVWMWHWAVPDDWRVPWHTAHRLPLPARAQAAKDRAVRRFATQTAPLVGNGEATGRTAASGENAKNEAGAEPTVILPPEELAHHTRNFEVVFR
ncbi:PIG-L deacetylase family protein [Streptomyces tsukubensis]|uniref:PIG-L family deacetylase n=1 Tax=Streptomyces tsukubensis TaxID=83656 RepID=A0A1V4AGH9_9ACTN|nr:PIG-L family deacetylase [Streptomyces tsukubensis]OON82992.1 PIG-L family deacetylase [Streptomyces tsukubensis]QFR97483.1 PIG-L family deacetylase [Streptomyces tsukubensis]